MKLILAVAAAATLAAQPAVAHPEAAHLEAVHSKVAHKSSAEADVSAIRAVLAKYQSAMERLDPAGTEQLFSSDSAIFESGGVEGTYANYLAHHLTPELAEFKSFRFSDYKLDIRFEGPVALATESYKYRIETKTGEVAERLGVATSVLKKVGGKWQIISMHNSARRPSAS